jgi:PLP dependent protein
LSIRDNIDNIRETLSKDITMVAVSKTKSIEEMKEAYECGIRDFGENKVQELMSKMDAFGDDVRWHLIGHLQSNKVKYVAGRTWLIHSLDSIKLLENIEKVYSSKGLTANVLIEINIGREESKTGILVENLEELIIASEKCTAIKILGLMAVIPEGSEETCRKYFSMMKDIWNNLKKQNLKNVTMKYLSMGMSGDYKMAIEEGANIIRIGQGIFGARNYKK